MIKYLVGLGNPGIRYERTRHNIGFTFLDIIASYHNCRFTSKFLGQFSVLDFQGNKLFLLKPETYMNNSGDSVNQMIRFFKGSPEQVMIVHDDLDLSLARIKIKKGGGDGGHNGLASITSVLGSNYNRLRIGIDKPSCSKLSVSQYVLSDFSQEEKKDIDNILEFLVKNINLLIANEHNSLMNYCSIHSRK